MSNEKKTLLVDDGTNTRAGGMRVGTIAHIGVATGVGRSRMGLMAAAMMAEALKPKTYRLTPKAMSALYERHLGAHEVEVEVREAVVALAHDAERRGFQAGLEAAADYLRSTASDFQQGVNRDQSSGRQLTNNERSTLKLNIEKIALLKGQAQHVLDQQFR